MEYPFDGWLLILEKYTGATRPGDLGTTGRQDPPRRTILSCASYVRLKAVDLFPYGYNMGGVSESFPPSYRPRNGGLGLSGMRLVDNPITSDELRPTKESDVLAPAQMIAVGDALIVKAQTPGLVEGIDDFSWGIVMSISGLASVSMGPESQRRRHNSRWNVLFCDGHVATLRQSALFNGSDPGVRSLWNKDNQPRFEFAPLP